MKIDELRKAIKNYTLDEKDKIIIELYKRIPKSIKEDYNIDKYIENINISVKKENKESFEQLKKEIEYFLDCAWDNLYSHPNKIIPKSERSKWRFKAKKYYKNLKEIKINSENGEIATDLLSDLYKTLSYGSNYLLFSSWNTFGAIQVSQSTFLNDIVERKLFYRSVKRKFRILYRFIRSKV